MNVKDFRLELSVTVGGVPSVYSFVESGENDALAVAFEKGGERLKITLTPKTQLTIDGVEVTCPCAVGRKDRVLMNGYQSWTDTRELTVRDRMYGLLRAPKFLVRKFRVDLFGDYAFTEYSRRRGEFHGFSYGYVRRRDDSIELVGSLNEYTGYTILYYSAAAQTLRIVKDCAGIVTDAPYEIMDIAVLSGGDDDVFDRWFGMMGIPKTGLEPLRGYTSWYNHYQGISEDIINKDLAGMKHLPLEPQIFQIDDGFQTAVGDWLSTDPNKFPNGLRPIVSAVHKGGMKAGLWLAPLVCEKTSVIYRDKKDWILKDANGELICCGTNWSGFYALDLDNEEVREYLRRVFDTVFNVYGFDLVKLDFLYAAAMVQRPDRTRGQSMCEAMDFLRELCGDKPILGCGVPLWSAFGKVEYCRIGCDVTLTWDDRLVMHRMHRERVSTKNDICDSIFRRQLDGRAFLNDPDVFILRRTNVKLSEKRKRQLATVNGLFGSVLFMSDDAGEYDEEQKALYKETVSLTGAEVKKIISNKNRIIIKYAADGSCKKLKIRL